MSSVLVNKVLSMIVGYNGLNSLIFYKKHGYFLDVKSPKTFSEKINARKLTPTKKMSKLSDKVSVKKFLQDNGLGQYVIPNYFHGESLTLKILKAMPEAYMLKSNVGAGFNLLVTGEYRGQEVLASIAKWNVKNFHFLGMERQYKNIKPMYLMEKALLNEAGASPKDYKFHCFPDGSKVVAVYSERGRDIRSDYFDEKWCSLNIKWSYPVSDEPPSKPLYFEEMLKVVNRLYKVCDMGYVRIDLYEYEGRIFFSEYTFTPGGGYSKFPSYEMDLDWGGRMERG